MKSDKGELAMDMLMRPDKRPAQDMESSVTDDLPLAKKQRAYLCRNDDDTANGALWRPLTYHRVSIRKAALQVDNHIRTSTCLEGLRYFRVDDRSSDKWKDPSRSPMLHFSTDSGSDMLGLWCWMAFGASMMALWWPDPSHMNSRAFDGTLKQAGLWPLWLLMLITWNLEFGPYQDSERKDQLRAVLSNIYQHKQPCDVPLFEAYSPATIDELEAGGTCEFDHSEILSLQLWDYLSTENRAGNMGRRIALNRFGAGVAANRNGLRLWHKRLFERTILALEMDLVTNKTLQKMPKLKPGLPEMGSEGGGSTNPKLLQLSNKSVLSGVANGIVTSMLTLHNTHQRRVLQVVDVVGAPFNAWQSWMQDLTKSAEGTSKYISENTSGAFTMHLLKFIRLLTDTESLVKCSFLMPGINTPSDGEWILALDAFEIGIEDELADLFGTMVLGATGELGYRGLFLEHFPYAIYEALGGADHRAVFQRFRTQYAIDKECNDLAGKGPHTVKMCKRSVFRLEATQRLYRLLTAADFKYTDKVKDVLEGDTRGNVSSLIVEQAHGSQAIMAKQAPTGRQWRRPARCMAATLNADIVDGRNDFINIPLEMPTQALRSVLLDSDFTASKKASTLDVSGIVSTSQKCPWHTGTAQTLPAMYADCAARQHAKQQGNLYSLEQCWQGLVCKSSHRMVLHVTGKAATASVPAGWYVAVMHHYHSAVMTWPVTKQKMTGVGMLLNFDLSRNRQQLLNITDVMSKDIMAQEYEWRSWAYQYKHMRACDRKNFTPGVRAFVVNDKLKIAELASRKAWYDLDRLTVVLYCKQIGAPLDDSHDLLHVLMSLIMYVLKITAQQALEICHRRIATKYDTDGIADALFGLDEAMNIIDTQDHGRVTDCKADLAKSSCDHLAFRSAYRKATVAARASSSSSAGGSSGSADAAPEAAQRPLPFHCTQAQAKLFIPPQSSIWQSNKRHAWCGHYDVPGMIRVSSPFKKFGSSDLALKDCLKLLWSQYLFHKALPNSACTVAGIFE